MTVDAFLDVFHPGVPANPRKMLAQCQEVLAPLRQLTDGRDGIDLIDDNRTRTRAKPFPIHPEPCGLFPWGVSDNGDFCLWLTDPDPAVWSIVITDGGLWWHHEGTLTDLLVGVLGRTFSCVKLPSSFPQGFGIEERRK
ncbi:hypothetical protein [Actinomadura scrupuli]|uniref:hypothetical protein n=1 Tax=Actinomadura scrupuli TaxID=559629 RepID=UPI003D975B8E